MCGARLKKVLEQVHFEAQVAKILSKHSDIFHIPRSTLTMVMSFEVIVLR
jgi:hypothetical protein